MGPTAPASAAPADGIDFGILPGLIGYQLRLAQIAIFRDFVAALADFEVTPTVFGSLVLIEANPGLKQTELARGMNLDRSTVVSVIDKLQARGLAVRRKASDDRRSNALALTKRGAALLAQLKPLVRAHERRLVENLDAEERAGLVRCLQRIFPNQR